MSKQPAVSRCTRAVKKRRHEMKKLLYRLPSSRSFTRLLSILAFAVLGLYYPSKSFATVYCKDNSPLTPCTRFSGMTCPPSTKPPYTTKCSTRVAQRVQEASGTAFIRIGDLGIGIVLRRSNQLLLLHSTTEAFAVPALSTSRKIQRPSRR